MELWWPKTSPSILHDQLLQVLHFLDEEFEKRKIAYWITGGTLLGALRHSGFIPHDDDIDLGVCWKDLEKIRQVAEEYPHLMHFSNRSRYQDKQFAKLKFFEERVCVDLFWREEGFQADQEFEGHEEVFPIQRIPFCDIYVNSFFNP